LYPFGAAVKINLFVRLYTFFFQFETSLGEFFFKMKSYIGEFWRNVVKILYFVDRASCYDSW